MRLPGRLALRTLLLLLPLLLAGCFVPTHCGPNYHGVHWYEPDLAGSLVETDPEGWDVYADSRPYGFPVEHPWLQRWNASVRTIGLTERVEAPEGQGHHRYRELSVHLEAPAKLSTHVLATQDAEVARPAVLRLLEALTDGNESQREAWADALLAEHDLPENVDDPAPEHRHFSLIPYELELPPERLRLQPFVDERLDDADEPRVGVDSGDWFLQAAFARTVAYRGDQEFRASPERNEFLGERSGSDLEPVRQEFEEAYASLGVGPVPEDVEYEASIC